MSKIKNLFLVLFAMLAAFAAPAFAQATGGSPFDALTRAVTFTDVVAAIMAVAAILAAMYVTMRGVTLILGFIRRG